MGDLDPSNTWFLGSAQLIIQMPYRLVQRFLHSSLQTFPILDSGHPFPLSCPFSWGSGPRLIPWAHPSPLLKRHLGWFNCFCTAYHRVPYTLQWGALPPSELPLSMGTSGPHLIHGSLGLSDSSSQMASRSVKPFLQGSLLWQTDRQTMLLGL